MTLRVRCYFVLCTLSVLGCLGCTTTWQPVATTGVSSRPPTETYDCAFAFVNSLGYTPTAASRESGFFKAERKSTGLGQAIMWGTAEYDVLTIATYRDPSRADATTLKITAERDVEKVMGMGAGHRNSNPPSSQTTGEVARLMTTCGAERANRPELERISVANFVRDRTSNASLVGSFDVFNGNDVPMTSVVLRCEVKGIGGEWHQPVALGAKQSSHIRGASFAGDGVPDGDVKCAAVDGRPLTP